MKNRKKLLLVLIALITIIGVTAGVTWAFLSYTKEGVKENTITAGAITFHYNEDSGQGISLIDALPLSDQAGQSQNKYFDFTITSNNNMETSIPYQITARKDSVANPLDDQYVKVYLTKVTTTNNTDSEIAVLFDTYDNLAVLNYNNHDEEILWTDSVAANTVNYQQKYRLRIWVADTLDFSPEKNQDGSYKEVNGDYVYPNNNKQFSIKLNVYAGDAKQADPTAPVMSNITLNNGTVNEVVDSSLNYDYVTTSLPAGTTSTTLNITTEDAADVVTVERIDGIAYNNNQSNVKRLSTVHNNQLNLVGGNNYFKITIKNSSNKKVEYIIKIVVEQDTDATLSSLSVSGCELNTTFNSNTFIYACDVSNNVTSVEVTATPSSQRTTSVVINGSNNALVEGVNNITITVTAEDTTQTKTYTVLVTREESQYKTLSTAIFAKYPAVNAGTADLTKTSTAANENGLFVSTATNSGAPTYYFRGVANNYLSFGGYTWRIVRINEDGTIRAVNSASIVGSNGARYTDVQSALDNWFNTFRTNYESYLQNGAYFCNETKFQHNTSWDWTNMGSLGMTSSYTPDFRCNSSNQIQSYYGLLSADEALHAGNLPNNISQNDKSAGVSEGYIFDLGSPTEWLQADESFDEGNSFFLYGNKGLCMNDGLQGVKPVINLKSNVIVSGKGTQSEPWTVQYNNN